jgi:predicted alpha/beta hydrolase family esterase
VQKLGTPHPHKTPLLVLPGAKSSLKHEWTPICQKLSNNHNFYITILHFNLKLKKEMLDTVVNVMYQAIFQNHNNNHNTQKVIIMGKSIGGVIAQMYTQMYPEDVLKLVLIAPVVNDRSVIQSLSIGKVPVMLLWTRDDTVVSYDKHVRKWKKAFNLISSVDEDNGESENSSVKKKKSSAVAAALVSPKHTPPFRLYTQDSGGHRILDAYYEPILSFLQS